MPVSSPNSQPPTTALDARTQRTHAIQYFLGAHRPQWLSLSPYPLFVSHRTLRARKALPRARTAWALDSGGFTELSQHGAWRTSASEYVTAVRRYHSEIGQLQFAAQQDWMCEPEQLVRTGLSVEKHQSLTIDNYLDLMGRAPELPWMPVLQGWALGDHERHVEQWLRRGVDLLACPIVGVGSICRRTNPISTSLILSALAGLGLRLHAFGCKITALRFAGGHIASADSMAWSFAARRDNRSFYGQLVGKPTGAQNRLSTATQWFEESIAPLLATGFCPVTGTSLRDVAPDEQDASAGLHRTHKPREAKFRSDESAQLVLAL